MMRKEIYLDMLFGVFLFVSGMIALYIIMKHLSQSRRETPIIILKEDNTSLSELTDTMKNIERNLSLQTPKGEVTDMTVNVSDTVKMLYNEKNRGLNWSSFTITNIGNSPVYMAVNTWRRPQSPIYPGENIDVDFKRRGAIKKIYLVCDRGQTSTVKIHAVK